MPKVYTRHFALQKQTTGTQASSGRCSDSCRCETFEYAQMGVDFVRDAVRETVLIFFQQLHRGIHSRDLVP